MGYRADETKQTGTFYLKTNSKAPFCGEQILGEDHFFPLAICIYNVKFGLKYSREYCH